MTIKMKSVRGRGIDRTARTGPHDGRNLRNKARSHRVAEEDITETGEPVDPLVDSRAARIVHADDRGSHLNREIKDLADLFGVHLTERAADDGEILGIDIDETAVDPAVAGDDPFGGGFHFIHSEGGAAMLNKSVEFHKAAGVEKSGDPLTCGHLSAGVLLGDPLFTAARSDFLYPGAQIPGFGRRRFPMGKGIHINAQSIWLLYFCTPHRRMRR